MVFGTGQPTVLITSSKGQETITIMVPATLGTGSRGPKDRPAFTLMVFGTGKPMVLEARLLEI